MAMQIQKKKFDLTGRPQGEPMVWFTAMGLALGLTMIIFLLGLILIKGVAIFWPARAVRITLAESAGDRASGATQLAGRIEKKQQKIVRDLSRAGSNEEWQLFIGNKDTYGFNFIYVDYDDIAAVDYPKDLMQIERLEYGDAFGFPLYIEDKSGERLDASQADFDDRLRSRVRRSAERWANIKKIEKKQIGLINHKIEALRLKRRALEEARADGEKASAASAIQEETAGLQARYEILAEEARTLRAIQREDTMAYRLVTGEEKSIPIGRIVTFYYPNRLSVLERAGHFLHRLWRFVSTDPREANTEGGIFPAIFGTLVMTVLMSLAVTPFGVIAAIYLREYARQGLFVRSVRVAVNNLAGVPSIVFGVFGLGFFVYFVGGTIDSIFFKESLPTPTFGTGGILWASLTLALLTVPVVIVATEEALAAVPRSIREGSLACGASKWQTIQRIILPAAAPGMLTGLILAMARGAGEVAPLMLVGVVKLAPNLPLDNIFPFVHLERKFMHLGFHIYDLGFQSPDSEAAKPMVFAATLLLIGLVMLLNIGAIQIRSRLRKKYAMGAF